jgi:hypothetical protein
MCSYYGYHFGPGRPPPVGALARTVHLAAAAAVRVAKAVDALPLSHTDGGTNHGCAGPSEYKVLASSYFQHPGIDLWAQLSDCPDIANGYISAAAADIGTLLASYG